MAAPMRTQIHEPWQ